MSRRESLQRGVGGICGGALAATGAQWPIARQRANACKPPRAVHRRAFGLAAPRPAVQNPGATAPGKLTMTPASPLSARPLVGIALVVIAVLFFALGDTLTKTLTQRHPVTLVVAIRYGVSLVLLLALVAPRLGAQLWRTQRTGLVLLRALVLATASLSMGYALKLMPVGETIAIMYLSPFAVMALAVPLLGEKVTPLGWFLAVLGFSGVLVILRPGAGLDATGVMFSLLNAVCATAFHLLTRTLSRSETTIAMLFHVTLVGTVASTLMALPELGGAMPGLADFGLMALLGVLSTAGHFLFAAAYREAPASLIAPVNYLHLVWAAILGWVVFAHVPDGWTLVGMAMVMASGVAIALRAHREGRNESRRLARARAEAHTAPE